MKIELCSLINEDYLPGASTLLKCLKAQNINNRFNLLYEDNLLESYLKLTSIYPNINFLKVKKDDYAQNNEIRNEYRDWHINCFYRFDMFEIDCDRLVFLDLDLLVLGNISDLLNFNEDFGAVMELDRDIFNGGVLVFNKKFLNKKTKHDLIDLANNQTWSSDQPILNEYFRKYMTPIPKKYNVLTCEYGRVKDINILHYIGSKKPWMSRDKLFENFDLYLLHTLGAKKLATLNYMYKKVCYDRD
jgi:lipopolysaccharide biosynthesis glycosyltransferase